MANQQDGSGKKITRGQFIRWSALAGVSLGSAGGAFSGRAADAAVRDRRRELALVENGTPEAVIIWWSKQDSPVPEFAASQLRDYVKKMSGAEVPVLRGTLNQIPESREPSSALVVVTGAGARRYRKGRTVTIPGDWLAPVASRLAGAKEDSFAIDTSDNRLVLAGVGYRGSLYAAYELLQRLGIRFFAPNFEFYQGNAEYVPTKRTVSVSPLRIKQEPSMAYRRKYVEEGWSHTARNLSQLIDWMAKRRQNILVFPSNYGGQGVTRYEDFRDDLLPELNKRGIVIEVGGHGFQTWLPPDEYPQYYVDGYNVFDVTNEDAVSTYVNNVVDYLRTRPEIEVFDAWPPDSARWPPQAIERFGSIANAEAYVIKQLTERVKQELPDVVIEALAYRPATEPPDPEYMYDPEANIVDIAPYDRSYRVPIYDDSSEANAYYDDLIKRWRQAYQGNIGIYEYYRKYAWHSLPCAITKLIGEELPYYQQQGANGIGMYSEPADWISYEPVHALVADLAWDIDVDIDSWRRSYLSDRFGRANKVMARYLDEVENACRAIFTSPRGEYDNLDSVTTALNAFVEAQNALSSALRLVPQRSSAAFVIKRLQGNVEYAVSDTKISYYELVGERQAQIEAAHRTADLVNAHTFDGTVLKNVYSVRRYQSGVTTASIAWARNMYRQYGTVAPLPPGTHDLSEAQTVWEGNQLGPVERDQSNGGADRNDGTPMSIRGQNYANGLGTFPYSEVGFAISGYCHTLTGYIGIDDSANLVSGSPSQVNFQDAWDFRNHQDEQVIPGEGNGTYAVLGITDSIESQDPSWERSPVPDKDGEPPIVLSFDGIDDVVRLPGVDELDLSQGFAFEAWVYPRSRAEYPRLLQRAPGLQFYINNDGTLKANLTSVSGEVINVTSNETVPLDTWTNVAMLYEVDDSGGRVRLFLNGAETTYRQRDWTFTGETELRGKGNPAYIGNRAQGDRSFDGLIAYARLVTPADALESWRLDLFPTNIYRKGSIFQVWADNVKVFDSGLVTDTMPAVAIDVRVSNAQQLRLITLRPFDENFPGPTDWAEVQLQCNSSIHNH